MKILKGLLQHNRTKLVTKTYKGWLTSQGKVLDVGCGDGILTDALSRKYKLKVTGCDVEKFLIKPLNFVLMKDKNKLPFPNSSFDIVTFNDVLHHTSASTQYSLLKEALRIAKKSVLIFEAKPSVATYLFDFLLNKISHPSMNVPFAFKDKKGWDSLFRKFSAKVDYRKCPRSLFSPFAHFAFRLHHFSHPIQK